MTRMRLHRQRTIHLTRREGQVARPFLSRELGISLPTITNLVRGLMSDGLLIEDGYGASQGGRRAALLKLNPEYAYAVGVEVSLSGMRSVLVDLGGHLVDERHLSDGAGVNADETVARIIEVTEPLVRVAPTDRLKGIGVGIAGLVDRDRGISIKFPHCDTWSNVPIKDMLEEHFGLDTCVDNDVQASTLAEFRYGAARGTETFLYLHLGHGIRLGMLLDGKIFHGVHGHAGELGHVVVDETGPVCYCGNYGCLESLAGPMAIVAQAREAMSKGVESSIAFDADAGTSNDDIEAVLQAAADGDRLAMNLVERAGTYIGRVVANIANVFDPSMFILAGGLTSESGPMGDIIRRVFSQTAMPQARDSVEIRRSVFADSPCAMGAATLVLDRMFEQLTLE